MGKKITLPEAVTAMRQKQSELDNCDRAVQGLLHQLYLAMQSRERVSEELRAIVAIVQTLSNKGTGNV